MRLAKGALRREGFRQPNREVFLPYYRSNPIFAHQSSRLGIRAVSLGAAMMACVLADLLLGARAAGQGVRGSQTGPGVPQSFIPERNGTARRAG